MENKKIDDFLKGSDFDVSLRVDDSKRLDNSYEFKLFSTSSRKAIDVLMKIGDFIRDESYARALSKEFTNTFDEVLSLLFSYLTPKIKDTKNPTFIETKLRRYIKELNDFEHDPKELVDELISIKEEKINFWNTILEEYLSKREEYNSRLFWEYI